MKNTYAYLVVIFLIVVSCVAFGRIAGNDFVNFDDPRYIIENPQIKSGINLQTIKWAFTAVVVSNWHPLTLLSHTLDWSLFGANAYGHHLVSLLFHIGAVIFLFFFLYKTTSNIWPAAFAAALFALHPLRVESVAWVAERKDVLSMFFGMATIYAYTFYAESSKLSHYFLCLILFALALMSKPMMVTLPFVLMLLDYWPLKRWQKALSAPVENRFKLAGRLVWEKAPFILLTIASSILTFWAQDKVNAITSIERLHFPERFSNAIVSCVAYLGKTFWPVNLAVFYPYDFFLPLWKILISGLILILITVVVLYYIKKLPFLFTGWFWYLGTLIPVIGLVQVGTQAMADRYTYLPSIGIAIILTWGILSLIKSMHKKILFPVGIAILAILAVLTWKQCGYWKNSMKLFNNAVLVTKDNYLAHNNRGMVYAELGQYQLAINDYNETIRLKPDDNHAYINRGNAYNYLGQHQRAIEDYNQAIRIRPDNGSPYSNRGVAYFMQGNREFGCRDAQKACELGNCKTLETAKVKGLCR